MSVGRAPHGRPEVGGAPNRTADGRGATVVGMTDPGQRSSVLLDDRVPSPAIEEHPGHPPTVDAALVDRYGRVATDLRISITDRCDLRCTYCMPEDGLDWMAPSDRLDLAEIERLARLFVGLGVRTIRLTGGEPLLHPHITQLVERLSLLGLDDLALTTNGTRLAAKATELRSAGLSRVNISLDSLDRERFRQITRRDALDQVLAGIDAAIAAGLTPVKLNCVVLAGTNDDELLDFVGLARTLGCHVRFIENMPLGADALWRRESVVDAEAIIDTVNEVYPIVAEQRGHDPAAVHRFADGADGSVGVIASVTDPFCSTCDRLRLTSDGFLRTCLFADTETDLRGPLRAGASDDKLAVLITGAVEAKQAGHAIGQPGFEQPVRVMSRIGG